MIINEKTVVAAAFFILLVALWKPLARFIGLGLDNRSAKIKKELDEALRLKEEAQTVLALYQRKQIKATQEIDEIIKHAQSEAERIIEKAKADIEDEIKRRTELAVQKIGQAEALVVQELKTNAVDITVSAARALIIENLGKETANEIMSEAIAGIGRKFH